MNIIESLSFLNPFSRAFVKNQRFEKDLVKQLQDNSVGMSDVEYDLSQMYGGKVPDVGPGDAHMLQRQINFSQVFEDKRERIAKYREMTYYPEIAEALDIIGDESVVQDKEGKIAHINILKEIPKGIYNAYLKEFEYIVDEVFNVRENLYDIFTKWLVEGELFVELIVDKKKKKLIGYKVLPAFTTFPVYSKSGRIVAYAQSVWNGDKQTYDLVELSGNQISYVHWGKYGKDLMDIRGYLEPTIRTYNQLKNLEDSLIVYRLVRAPERRVWNIEVGRLPTQKAEQFIRKMIHKYKKQLSYNSTTGAIDAARHVHSLSEDFWFAKRDGIGTSVETIGGTMNLGELDDVRLFQAKMYKTLKLPKTRWDPNVGQTQYQGGRDIDREELKFSLFINRIQNRFKKLLKDAFIEHIKFKFGDQPRFKKYLKPALFDIEFTQANFFKEMKDLELMEMRLGVLGTALTYATSKDEPENAFAREFVLRRYFQMDDNEYEENQRMLAKEREVNRQLAQDEIDRENSDNDSSDGDSNSGDSGGDKDKPDFGGGFDGDKTDDSESGEEENLDDDINRNDLQTKQSIKDFLQKPIKPKKRII